MVNIPVNKLRVTQKIVGKTFLAKERFFYHYVYFQNLAIRNCNYPATIKPQKLIVQLVYQSYQILLEKQLKQEILGDTNHLRSIYSQLCQAIISLLILLSLYPTSFAVLFFSGIAQWCVLHNSFISLNTLVFCLSIFQNRKRTTQKYFFLDGYLLLLVFKNKMTKFNHR